MTLSYLFKVKVMAWCFIPRHHWTKFWLLINGVMWFSVVWFFPDFFLNGLVYQFDNWFIHSVGCTTYWVHISPEWSPFMFLAYAQLTKKSFTDAGKRAYYSDCSCLQLLPQLLLVNQPLSNFNFNRGGHNLSCDWLLPNNRGVVTKDTWSRYLFPLDARGIKDGYNEYKLTTTTQRTIIAVE